MIKMGSYRNDQTAIFVRRTWNFSRSLVAPLPTPPPPMADCCNSTLKIGDPCSPLASTIDSIDPFAHSFAFNDVQTWIPQSFTFQNPVDLHPATISKQLLQELLRRWILPEFDGLHQGLGSGDAMAPWHGNGWIWMACANCFPMTCRASISKLESPGRWANWRTSHMGAFPWVHVRKCQPSWDMMRNEKPLDLGVPHNLTL